MIKKVRIKRFDKSIPLPEYKTSGATGFDFPAREQITIRAKEVTYVPLNAAIELPEGYFILLAARSSLHKRGLIVANGVGIFDADFSGEEDEYRAALYNFTDSDVIIEKGDRIMQGILIPFVRVDFEEVNEMGRGTRGGFGTTGVK
ncbi:MAG: hypothetical protein A2942_04915 [Candidatus Lloydbacteria bacterium RIFCSPLOWO2_01_FULL_50_20]|uniref:dUTP diphosphatase n=1 Tax=Candidatus Lloydbacteria bacterium RIFCSPLOWO2_01_FULL_50_20 TaxID=1798665 RepID=A0A1G2DDJ7_9BACT|nr:MAG: hypothetical protein A3C13_02400 [Candidatus Lloydbacteria bacterium RIFCSPHIGHO2_02_FULL_50_11]OGZ11709.1 MAG: hypothetical protein A2942_04915 [Candidatus Lloydbacteria bacterium RIFCSPLOWO2_01_FULL_50_20]